MKRQLLLIILLLTLQTNLKAQETLQSVSQRGNSLYADMYMNRGNFFQFGAYERLWTPFAALGNNTHPYHGLYGAQTTYLAKLYNGTWVGITGGYASSLFHGEGILEYAVSNIPVTENTAITWASKLRIDAVNAQMYTDLGSGRLTFELDAAVNKIHSTNTGFGAYNNLSLLPNGGNVGIGTTTPAEKLSVNGEIRAKEIKVEAQNWPDYVFEDQYQLISLTDLKTFIRKNKHLPDIPPAQEIEENGASLGELNVKLLKKIEELTLYILEQDQKLKDSDLKLLKISTRLEKLERNFIKND